MSKINVNALMFVLLTAVVKSGKMGAPSGPIYAQLMSEIDLDTYNRVVEFLIANKMITKTNHCLQATEKAVDLQAKMAVMYAEASAKVSA